MFSGDTDPCVSYEGTRAAVGFRNRRRRAAYVLRQRHGVPLALLDEKPLLFGPSLAVVPAGPQSGGHVTDCANGLAFVTGTGAHMPQFRPRAGPSGNS